jgi:hypothetical protein
MRVKIPFWPSGKTTLRCLPLPIAKNTFAVVVNLQTSVFLELSMPFHLSSGIERFREVQDSYNAVAGASNRGAGVEFQCCCPQMAITHDPLLKL